MSDYKKVIGTLPGFLKPRLRLFLSVDIVNSTAFKQKAMPTGWLRHGGSSGAKPQHEGAEDWFLPIAGFYHELERAFYAHWHRHAAQAQKIGWNPGDPPQLWKAAGDELLFCKTLSDYWQAWTCVRALIDAVNDHREALRKQFHMLDLKASAWLAGFPVNNVEIVVLSDRAKPENDETEGDPVLANFRLLERIYSKKKTDQLKHRYFRDFVGPSMDTGFRVAELSTARKMAISADLALMLAFTDIGLHAKTSDHGVEPLEFHYDGRVPLKGVIDGAPYPFFWLDTATPESLFACEDKINGPKPVESTHAVKDFCEKFLRDLGERHLPFIDGSSDAYFQPKSSFHASRLQSFSGYWQKGMDKSRQAAKAQLSDKAPDQHQERELTEQQLSERLNAILRTNAIGASVLLVAVGKNKKIYVSGIKQNAYCSDKISRMAEILEGCVKLGVLSKTVFEQYKKSLKEFEYKQHQSYCASSALQKMNELGIKLTTAQKSRLDRLNAVSPGF